MMAESIGGRIRCRAHVPAVVRVAFHLSICLDEREQDMTLPASGPENAEKIILKGDIKGTFFICVDCRL